MRQINSGRIGCFFGATIFALGIGLFFGFMFKWIWISNHVESKSAQLSYLEQDLDELDPGINPSSGELIELRGGQINIGEKIIRLYPKSTEGYELVIAGLRGIDARSKATEIYRQALSQGIKLPPLGSNEYS